MCQKKDARPGVEESSRPAEPEPLYSRSRTVRLVKGLPRRQLLQAIHHHARQGDVAARALGFYLDDLEQRREFQPDSVSAVKYAVEVLGMDAREASTLIRVSRELEELPELDRAFTASEISMSKLREVVRVAVPETELDWLAFAREHNCRQVEAAVSGARRGEKPPAPGKFGTPRVKFRIQYDLPAAVNAVWQTALEKLMGELGKEASPADAIKAMAEIAIATDPERRIPPGRTARKEPVYMVVYHVGSDGLAWHQGRDGQSPVPIETVLAARESARVVEAPDLEPTGPGGASAILFGERGSVPREARDPPTPAWMRDVVLAREGHSCAICGSRRDCTVHHVDSLADGGKTVIRRLVTVCGIHHSLIHEGLIILFIDEKGTVRVKDRQGRVLGRAIPAREALADAPEAFAFTEIEVVKSPTWDSPSTEIVAPPRSPDEDTTPSAAEAPASEAEATATPGDPLEAAGGARPDESPGGAAPTETGPAERPTWDSPPPEVVPAPRSPDAEATPSAAEAPASEAEATATAGDPLEAAGGARPDESPGGAAPTETDAQESPTWDSPSPEVVAPLRSPILRKLAYASLDQLSASLTAGEWRALEARLEWSASRKAFVLREDEGFGLEPPGARSPTGEGLAANPLARSRPQTLDEVIGQEQTVEGLRVAVTAARKRGDALGHVLLTGQPGLGKTTLAGILAREMGSRLHAAMGAHLSEPSQAIGLLARLERDDVLFIDEVHRVPDAVTECLHSAMEDRVVHALLCERGRTRSLRVELEPFTLAGATMEPGSLPDAFRARFGIRARLEPYPVRDLARVVARSARGEASELACFAVARRARGTPREALRLLDRARDEAQAAGSPVIEASHVARAARRLGIDPDGLLAEDLRILEVLVARGSPVGLEALAAITGIDASTIRSIHEPCLLARGYVVRTPRGREATVEARIRMARGALQLASAIPLSQLPPAVRMMILKSIRP